jgi:hypothetical protein
MALFINNIIWPGLPANQPDGGDLHAAQLAIFLGLVNGLASPAYMRGCLCNSDAAEQEEMYYQLANFVVAMLSAWRSCSWTGGSPRRRSARQCHGRWSGGWCGSPTS